MKYSVKNSGTIDFGAKATDNVTSVISNFWKKISGIINKKDDSVNKVEKPESGFIANTTLDWNIEASAEISVEEMAELLRISKEQDIHVWDMLKTMGNDLIKGSKTVLEALKKQGPEWLSAISELEDLNSELFTQNEIRAFKRSSAAKEAMKGE